MRALLCKFEQQFILVFSFVILLGSVELSTANVGVSNAQIPARNVIDIKPMDCSAHTKNIQNLMRSHIHRPLGVGEGEEPLQIEKKIGF